jgi:hypothetical protein
MEGRPLIPHAGAQYFCGSPEFLIACAIRTFRLAPPAAFPLRGKCLLRDFPGRAPLEHPAPAPKRLAFGRIFLLCSAGAPHVLVRAGRRARNANPNREIQRRSSCSFDALSHERQSAPASDRKGLLPSVLKFRPYFTTARTEASLGITSRYLKMIPAEFPDEAVLRGGHFREVSATPARPPIGIFTK